MNPLLRTILMATGLVVLPLLACASKFESAQPVWLEGKAESRNELVGLRAVFEHTGGNATTLRVAANSLYRARLNGKFLAHGPARGPHGFYRIDQWDLTSDLKPGTNILTLEVTGYNVNSFYLLDQPSFVQAEIVVDGKVVAATGGEAGGGFSARDLDYRVQKVQRTSFQRPFAEAYKLKSDSLSWITDPKAEMTAQLAPTEAKQLIPRRIPNPYFHTIQPIEIVSSGTATRNTERTNFWNDRSLSAIGPKLEGFPKEELEVIISEEVERMETVTSAPVQKPYVADEPVSLNAGEFRVLDLARNLTGFVGATISCKASTRLLVSWDELRDGLDVNFLRLGMVNAMLLDLEPGTYDFEALEPFTMRTMKFTVVSGACDLRDIYLREYANDDVWEATFACNDDRLNRVFEAGRQTYRQNATDVFMDCPSRERAGWLCDSFFTARTEGVLSPVSLVEKNFIENFLLPTEFKDVPPGMLPMCYPSDHYDNVFIPNWAMWFVVQLDEYAIRSGDRALIDALKPRVMALLEYFKKFHNSDGLLEKLDSWIFVEWSKANDFLRDVSYASNMLYAGTLDAASRLYSMPELHEQAEKVREVIRIQSFDGEFFVDNAVRKDDKLEVTRNRTEVCQYFAFFFDVATTSTHAKLWDTLVNDFGPKRKKTKKHPEIHMANAFIGNALRLVLLGDAGLSQEMLDDAVGYHLYMADRTGTLWENDGAYASCNHGFASQIVPLFYRDVLGVRKLDKANRILEVSIPNVNLDWCRGRLPTEDGFIEFSWRRENGKVTRELQVPAGWRVKE